MTVAQPAPVPTAAEQHQEQQEKAGTAAVAGGEKIALSKIDASSSRTSSISASVSSIEQDGGKKAGAQKRKWYRKLNPLRLRKIPPVPEERTVSPEYGANILSIILFQWMSPLMDVRV